jgi:hypothetical protein
MKNLILCIALLLTPSLSVSIAEAASSHKCVAKPGHPCPHTTQHTGQKKPAAGY